MQRTAKAIDKVHRMTNRIQSQPEQKITSTHEVR
jgi:hypothetical protein